MQKYFMIHFIGMASILLTLVVSKFPIIIITMSSLLMTTYIVLCYKNFIKGDIINFINYPKNIVIKLRNTFFSYYVKDLLLFFGVIMVFMNKDNEFLLTGIFALIFIPLEIYTLSYVRKKYNPYFNLNNESIDFQSDYTNRIYYSELKNISMINKNKIGLYAKNGNSMKINIQRIPKELKIKAMDMLIEKSKLNDVEIDSQIIEVLTTLKSENLNQYVN